ncbi:hypothetical protein ANCCAN_17948 [Ancylostoma caninum]|uniref:Uncharacterized protein n=1 Tax=Ancylostoma caninum TaxID=29170 RepID=A0A368FVD7_ANCCA|nr:hypothetical protein ANCCAN_17948 [Ancylostoma caninum]
MVSLYGHVIYALSTAIVSDHPTMQQSLIQAELPMATFSEWLFASVTRVPSINGLNAKVSCCYHNCSFYPTEGLQCAFKRLGLATLQSHFMRRSLNISYSITLLSLGGNSVMKDSRQ